jgi:hypothetical protein
MLGVAQRTPEVFGATQVGAVDDRAEVDASRLADAALRRKPIDASAFTAAPDPLPTTSSETDAPIRRLWDKKTMSRERFNELFRGTDVAHITVHEDIEEVLPHYLDAVTRNLFDADDLLDEMIETAKAYCNGTRPDKKVKAGLWRFVFACEREKGEIAGLLQQRRAAPPKRKSLAATGSNPLTAAATGPNPLTAAATGPNPLTGAATGPNPLTGAATGPNPLTGAATGTSPTAAASQQQSAPDFAAMFTALKAHIEAAKALDFSGARAHPVPRRPQLVPPAIAAERQRAQLSGTGPTTGQPVADEPAALEDQPKPFDADALVAEFVNAGKPPVADEPAALEDQAKPFDADALVAEFVNAGKPPVAAPGGPTANPLAPTDSDEFEL